MDLDGQSIEKRDFPIVRRGYEPAAVDAHLRSIAIAASELSAKARQGESVGAAAATQVQGIIAAAEAAAAQIVGDAEAESARTIQEAQQAAQRTRSEAVAQSQAHVAAVGQAAATLRSRVESMDADLQSLVDTLRSGGAKLAQGLGALERDMAALYDSASGRDAASPQEQAPSQLATEQERLALIAEPIPDVELPPAPDGELPPAPDGEPQQPPVLVNGNGGSVADAFPPPAAGADPAPADIDGARLIALNMALNGDSREQTDRYLAEHFDLPDREKLVAEVYSAIEG